MTATNAEVSVGSLATDFTLQSNSGEEVTLSDSRGHTAVVLYFMREFT
jgi:peroxiredoxin